MFKQIAVMFKLLRLLVAGKAEVKKVMTQNGWKSTRFWLTIFTIGLNVLGAFIGMLPAPTVAWIVFGLTLAYLVLRTISKWTATTADDEIVDALEEPLKKLGVDTKAESAPIPPKSTEPSPAAGPQAPPK